MKHLKPSHFTSHPWGSILQKSEAETIARNIMVIRERLGDKWEISFDEYKKERLKDGGFSYNEESYFNEVIKLIPDAIGAIHFCKEWAESARKNS